MQALYQMIEQWPQVQAPVLDHRESGLGELIAPAIPFYVRAGAPLVIRLTAAPLPGHCLESNFLLREGSSQ